MGQAKNRGNQEFRIKQALEKAEKLMPEFLTCNNCGDKVTSLRLLSTRGMKGVDVACAGTCDRCGHSTFGVSGDPEHTQKVMEILAAEFNGELTIGMDNCTNNKSTL